MSKNPDASKEHYKIREQDTPVLYGEARVRTTWKTIIAIISATITVSVFLAHLSAKIETLNATILEMRKETISVNQHELWQERFARENGNLKTVPVKRGS